MSDSWAERRLRPGETIMRFGAGRHGKYVIIKTASDIYWRLWENGRQDYCTKAGIFLSLEG